MLPRFTDICIHNIYFITVYIPPKLLTRLLSKEYLNLSLASHFDSAHKFYTLNSLVTYQSFLPSNTFCITFFNFYLCNNYQEASYFCFNNIPHLSSDFTLTNNSYSIHTNIIKTCFHLRLSHQNLATVWLTLTSQFVPCFSQRLQHMHTGRLYCVVTCWFAVGRYLIVSSNRLSDVIIYW